MLTFTLAVFLLLVTPGPGVLSLAGVGAAYGARAGLWYMMGLFVGTNIVAVAVVSGLAAIVFAVPVIRNVLLIASACYLLFLAFKIAFAGRKIAIIRATSQPGFVAGTVLQVINPKAYAVNTALFTGFAFLPQSLLFETLIKFAILNAIWLPIHYLWLLMGSTIRQLNLQPRTQFFINIFMAAAMIGVVALAGLSLI